MACHDGSDNTQASGLVKHMAEESSDTTEACVYSYFSSVDRDEELNVGQVLKMQEESAESAKQGSISATHVVTKIRYGCEWYFAFKKECSSQANKSAVTGKLMTSLDRMSAIVKGGGNIAMALNEEWQRDLANASFAFHGDVAFDDLITAGTAEQALEIMSALPNEAKKCSVPKIFYLTPLQDVGWDRTIPLKLRVVKNIEIPALTMEKVANDFQTLIDLEAKLGKLQEELPELKGAIKIAKGYLSEAKQLRDHVKKTLPMVRDGTEPMSKLTDASIRNAEWVESYLDLLPDLASLVKDIQRRISKENNLFFSWNQGREVAKGNKCLFLYLDLLDAMPEGTWDIDKLRDRFKEGKRVILCGISNFMDYVQANAGWEEVTFIIADRRVPDHKLWKVGGGVSRGPQQYKITTI